MLLKKPVRTDSFALQASTQSSTNFYLLIRLSNNHVNSKTLLACRFGLSICQLASRGRRLSPCSSYHVRAFLCGCYYFNKSHLKVSLLFHAFQCSSVFHLSCGSPVALRGIPGWRYGLAGLHNGCLAGSLPYRDWLSHLPSEEKEPRHVQVIRGQHLLIIPV